ncbi:MAG: DNA ligase [Desulfotalea sp.]
MLSEQQLQILSSIKDEEGGITSKEFEDIASGAIHLSLLSDEQIVAFTIAANAFYRGGFPAISDILYDDVFFKELKLRRPYHSLLRNVEPEFTVSADHSKTVDLPTRMLSTDKAYDIESIRRWGKRIEKSAREMQIDFSELIFRGTPKLDGFAAYDDGETLYTRGDGKKGTDVTRAFDRGLQVAREGTRGQGAGEIVVDKNYFAERLAPFFDNSRNFQASLIKEKELEAPVLNAVKEGAAVFYPFSLLPDWTGNWSDLSNGFDRIVKDLWNSVPYDIDGVVFEILKTSLRSHMGATRHHHRWQIAFKKNTEKAIVEVVEVLPQTSRSGRVNPVAEIVPVRLSGAKITRVTAHHYGMVRNLGIGKGARISLVRAGEVIPKIDEVVEPVLAESLDLPDSCPSCGGALIWEADYLYCNNKLSCPAQIMNSVEHFFKVLGNVDGFGPSSIEKLYTGKIVSIFDLYKMEKIDFEKAGFGPKQSENMVVQLDRSRTEQIEDYRFLAAFGVNRLGLGNCEKLLECFPLDQIFNLGEQEIVDSVQGFQEKTAHAICSGLETIQVLFDQLYDLGFNLSITSLISEKQSSESAVAGKVIVFTGSMDSGSRGEMEKNAKDLGAKIGKSITGKTDLLVMGKKVGESKKTKAEKLGVLMLSEKEYYNLLG